LEESLLNIPDIALPRQRLMASRRDPWSRGSPLQTRITNDKERGKSDHGRDVSRTQPEERWKSEQNHLAILALHDPGDNLSDEPYGLAGFSPRQTLGALSLAEVSAHSARSITRLSPREQLAVLELFEGGV
jgi:hypothetical protein